MKEKTLEVKGEIPTCVWKDLDKMEGTIHVGIEWGKGKDTQVIAFRDKETGKMYIIDEKTE